MTKQAISIKVGCKTYNVSNSWNSLFLCGKEAQRSVSAFSVFEQLGDDKYKGKVEVRLISHTPEAYEEGVAGGFDDSIIDEYLDEMCHRYTILADSESRNYIQYNQKNPEEKMKLLVLIVEGTDDAVSDSSCALFLNKLQSLVQKSRAAGIHVISFINDLPANDEDHFKYYGTPVHVMRKGFFMKDTTNAILKELYALGLSPIVNLSYDREGDTIWIGINLEACGVHLSFSFNYDAHSVDYALLFPVDREIDFETKMDIYRTLRTDASNCYDGFSDDLYEGHLAITGTRWASQMTPLFVQGMIEEIYTLKVVEKLKMLQNPGFVF